MYDYTGYFRNITYQVAYGNGFGVWMISASREYYSGGPLKQYFLVHHRPAIFNYLSGGHIGTLFTKGSQKWKKVHGPCLIHLNKGMDQQVKADVIGRSKVEVSLWLIIRIIFLDWCWITNFTVTQILGQNVNRKTIHPLMKYICFKIKRSII